MNTKTLAQVLIASGTTPRTNNVLLGIAEALPELTPYLSHPEIVAAVEQRTMTKAQAVVRAARMAAADSGDDDRAEMISDIVESLTAGGLPLTKANIAAVAMDEFAVTL